MNFFQSVIFIFKAHQFWPKRCFLLTISFSSALLDIVFKKELAIPPPVAVYGIPFSAGVFLF
jgi:hypothetical protein